MLFALRFRSRVRVRAAVALLAGLSGTCGPEVKPNELDWRVSFICEADRAEADALLLRVFEGGCKQAGEALYEAKLARGEEPPAVDRIGGGSYGVEAIAYAGEQVVASTCVKVTLPRSEPIALKLRSPKCTVETADPVVILDAATEVEPEAGTETEIDAEVAVDASTAADAGSADDARTVADTGSAPDTGSAIDARVVDAMTGACPSGCPSGASCGGSACICNDGNQTLCGNSCVNLATEVSQCGSCGRACGGAASCQNGACKPDSAGTCTAHRNAGHDYLVCTDVLTWLAARDRCRSFGLVLVAIDSQAENDFVRDHLAGAPRWIGANDLGATGSNCRLSGDEGSWYWASATSDHGTPFCTAAASGPVSCAPVNGRYQNWHYGEPNNGCSGCTTGCGEGQDCASIDPPGTWDDDSCSARFGYVCETP